MSAPVFGVAADTAVHRLSSKPLISIRGLSKSFRVQRTWQEILRSPWRSEQKLALDAVNLDVHRGELFGLLGPNGAGKSTLFKVLSTLLIPDAGTVEIDGLQLDRDGAAIRRILTPVTPDERSLYWRVSARENLLFYAALYGVPPRQRAARINEVLELVELDDAANKLVGVFSSGMKQRLLIARALLSNPRILLLDEPTRSLDPVAARKFRAFLRNVLLEVQGCTVVLATHNPEEALELCDRLGVLDRGRLIATGTAGELSRSVGQDRLRITTSTPNHEAFDLAERKGLVNDVVRMEGEEPEWHIVELTLAADETAANLNGLLVSSGATVGLIERVRVSLADLIERLIHSELSSR